MASFYVPLPAFRAPAPLDFSGLNEGLDALGKHVEKNRLLQEQKELGEALRSGGQPTATSSSVPQYGSSQPNRLLGSPTDARSFLKQQEGYTPVAQWDRRQNSGGYGSRAAPGETFTPEKAEQYLTRDMQPVQAWIESNLPNATPEQKTALVSFGYNLGTDDLDRLKPDLQAGNWDRVAQRMVTFNKALNNDTGQLEVVDGLTARRNREAAMLRGTGQPEVSPPRPQAASGGPNFSGAADVAFRQGRVDAGLSLLEAQRERENQSYARSRQERLDERQARLDAQTTEVNDITLQEKRQELETVAQRKLAGIAQTIGGQTDPAARAAMWQKFVGVNPRVGSTLQQYGIDPRNAEAGIAFLIAEARGLTDPKPSEFKTFKQDEGIFQSGATGLQVLREPQAKAEDNKVVSPGQTIVSPSGRPVYVAPDKPLGLENVAPGNTVYDPNSRSVLFKAEPKPEDRNETTKIEQSLRKEWTALTADLRTINDSHNRMQTASKLDTGAADIAMVYSYMKMLDPTSVVREGEYATAENTGGVPEKIVNVYNKILSGTRLTPAQRQEFLGAGEALTTDKSSRFAATRQQFANTVRAAGFDPSRVMLDEGGSQAAPPNGGAQLAPKPQGVTDQQIIQEAQQAIQQGKDPAAVRQQLEAWGIRF